MDIKNADDWEQHYRDKDTPWDKGYPAPGLTAFLSEREAPKGRILVPGCGLGHDVRALSKAGGEDSQVIGLDISATAMELASEFPQAVGEKFEVGDFFNLSENLRGTFDWIWEHTCFCAIGLERRADYVQACANALKPGGRLFAVFYLDPYDEQHEPGEGPPHGCTLEELEELFAPHFEITEHWQPSEAYPGREGKELMVILQKQ